MKRVKKCSFLGEKISLGALKHKKRVIRYT
jgi:hypothetical protein